LPSVGARVFVAVDVGDAVRREAARVVSALQMKLEAAKTPPKVVWVKPAALHVTIRFLGEVEPAEVERITPLLAPPILLAPFDVQWRGIGTFPNNRHPRALWLGVIHGAAQLAAIEAEISKRLAGAAVDLDDRALLPHLTLGRVKMAGAGVDWPKVLQSAEVKNATSFIDRVTLYQSKLSQHGPHYTELVSAPLIDQAITRSPDR
jgi:2'-5' RNA ligase